MTLMIVMVGLDLALPRLIQRIVDQGVTPGNLTIVWQTALIMLGISVFNLGVAVVNTILSVRVAEGFARDLRREQFNKIQELSFGNLDRLRTGNLIVRMTSDITSVANGGAVDPQPERSRPGAAGRQHDPDVHLQLASWQSSCCPLC